MGEASPRRLLQGLRLSELGTWRALWEINPWGEDRADLRAALGHMLLAEIHRDRKARPKAFELKEFMPYWLEPKRAAAPSALEAQVLKAFGLKLDPAKLRKR